MAKTKTVDGEELPASAFLYVGDPNEVSTWKLPVHFKSAQKTKSHIRNALARYNQTEGIPEKKKKSIAGELNRLAKSHGIDSSGFHEKHPGRVGGSMG